MKTRYIIFAFAALAAVSCSKDAAQSTTSGRQVVITASLEEAPDTRAAVQDGGRQVFWEPGDAIKVFCDGEGSTFESQCTSMTKVSDFVGSLNFVGGGNEGAIDQKYIFGLYPYRLDATSDGNSVTTTLPSSQAGREGSFATGANITMARSDSFGLAFYNVCGGIRFTLTQEGIKRVTLEGNNGETLAGTFTASFDGNLPVVQSVSEGDTSITLRAPEGGSFKTGVWYYIVALPCSLPGGFKLTFRSEEGSGTLNYNKAVSIRRGVFGSLADVDAGIEFGSGGGDDPQDIKIEIDGEFWDWASVPDGLTGTYYKSFKVWNDNNYIYFYSRRDNNPAIWGGNGYYYYYIDGDNDSTTGINHDSEGFSGVTMYMYFYPFTGTSSAPEFATTASGSAKPSSSILQSVLFAGAYTSSEVELETRLPLSTAGIKKGDVIGLYSWGNKSASDFKHTKLEYTVK